MEPIKPTDKITIKQGYEAMLHLLQYYLQLTDSTDLTDILSGGEYLPDGSPADSAFWDYWVDAIERLRLEGPIFKQEM
ncbi:MAG: hypothetical protein EOP52_09670 [Sphingobacteriales bacterium]|nr:MAG: hypothetical protein EOP52_09670 [Sphingobacteriales bacterium]